MSVNMKKMILMGMLSISVGANAADLPESATLKYSSNYGIPAIMTFKRLGNDSIKQLFARNIAGSTILTTDLDLYFFVFFILRRIRHNVTLIFCLCYNLQQSLALRG